MSRTSTPNVVRIATGSRLHFGLLDTAAPFGGIGVMIDTPITEVVVSPAPQFVCDEQRGRDIAIRLMKRMGHEQLPGCRIDIRQRAQPHHGLGTGTQLAMALADALATFCGATLDHETLATQIAQRGNRSAVGSHGYFQGGLIYESTPNRSTSSPSPAPSPLNAIAQRIELPDQWRVLVFRPSVDTPTISGAVEQQQFDRLGSASVVQREALQRIVEDELLPSARGGQFDAFTDALARYNHASGMLFEHVQGGPYSTVAIDRLVKTLQALGAAGVGQSSWGPSVFSWFETESSAIDFAAQMESTDVHVMQCRVQNNPRKIDCS